MRVMRSIFDAFWSPLLERNGRRRREFALRVCLASRGDRSDCLGEVNPALLLLHRNRRGLNLLAFHRSSDTNMWKGKDVKGTML